MSKKMYLINLSGGGDTTKSLVTEDVWNWINSGYNSDKSSYYEDLSEPIKEQMKLHNKYAPNCSSIMVTIGSYDNDRAIQAPGIEFSSTKELMKYIKENDIEIVEEYEGCIY